MGRMSPDYYVQDGVVPRTRLPDVLRRIEELVDASTGSGSATSSTRATATSTRSSSTTRAKGETEAAKELAEAILGACLDAGGSLTGEHGVGVDKACSMPKMFSERDLEAFERLRRAFDPDGLANPGKVIPTPRLCGEVPGPYRRHPARADRRWRAFLASRRPRPRSGRRRAEGRTIRIGADLDADGMDRVLEHEAGDLTCTVEAGIRLSALAAALAPAGQRLSLDPPGDPTIGACLAARSPGRCATASAPRATSSSASRSCSPTGRSRTPAARS